MPTLPPPAQARLGRLERFTGGSARTSLLSVPAAAALEAVGLDTVGEVMGGSVQRLTTLTFGTCGYGVDYTAPAGPRRYVRSPPVRFGSHPRSPQRVQQAALVAGYSLSLTRLLAEAEALGADGVVGIRVTRAPIAEECEQFVMLGTAVRARSRRRPATPFTTELGGPDVAALLLGGWTPVALQICVERAVRHNDQNVASQTARANRQVNLEVAGWTDLVTRTRDSVRTKMRTRIASSGADGAILGSATLSSWDAGCDRVAEAVLHGTTIARFAGPRRAAPTTLTVLPVRSTRGATR